MACSACGRRRQQGAITNSAPQGLQRNAQLSNGSFVQAHYVGEDDAPIPTLLSHVTYGKRKYGTLLWVAKIDYEATPELWKTPDEFAAIIN